MFFAGRTLLSFLAIVGGLILVGLLFGAPALIGTGLGFLFSLFLLAANGWAVYAFLRYRQGRQDELLHMIAAAVEAKLPLVPAIRAFLRDRPNRGRGWEAANTLFWLGSCVALPLYGYVRVWLGFGPYNWLVERLANRLENGEPLSAALRHVRGVTFREARLAAEVGEATGSMAAALRAADRERTGAGWVEVAPRVLYPLLVLVFVSGVTTFLVVAIMPRFKRIFDEFGQTLPTTTRTLISWTDSLDDALPFTPLLVLLAIGAAAVLIANPTVRWHAPLIGRLYRWGVQSEILRTLGRLLGVGRTVPAALDFLAQSDDLPPPARRRLERARAAAAGGAPLADALGRAGLLPGGMAALVAASERANTLPWALTELGDHLAGRAVRLVRRASQVVGPALVVAVGLVVGFIAISMFAPLIELLTRLGE